jgi:hypothetical protein
MLGKAANYTEEIESKKEEGTLRICGRIGIYFRKG